MVPLKLGLLSSVMGKLGESSLDSEGLKSGGKAMGSFVPISVNIHGSKIVLNKLKELRKNA